MVEYQEEQVELQPRSGRCMVNNVPVDTAAKLTHGKWVVFGCKIAMMNAVFMDA